MNAPQQTVSFMAACKEIFGMRADQKPLDFAKEVRALTAEDKAEMIPEMEKMIGKTISTTTP